MKARTSILAAIAVLMVCSCDSKEEQNNNTVRGRFKVQSAVLTTGEEITLPLQYSEGSAPYADYDFEKDPYKVSIVSDRPDVAEVVAGKGIIKAVSAGEANITATIRSYRPSIRIVVVDKEVDKPQKPQKPENPDSLKIVNASWNWTTASTGVTTGYATFPLFNKQASISIARYPASKLSLSIAYHTGSGCLTTSEAGKEAGAAVAINGSFFNTSTLVANTFYASKGTVVCNKALDTRSNGIVGISSNGHSVDILTAQTSEFSYFAKAYDDVLAAGPVLLQMDRICDNIHNDFNDTSHPRSIIGKDKEGNIWMVVIDGRFKGKGDGASIEECSLICHYLGMCDAINLDGGGSSSLWTPTTGVINHPCDNSKWDHAGERKDPTIFVAK